MKQTTIRMHMNPEESLGTVGHVIDKDLRNKEIGRASCRERV